MKNPNRSTRETTVSGVAYQQQLRGMYPKKKSWIFGAQKSRAFLVFSRELLDVES